MSSMRNNFCLLMLAFIIGTGSTVFAQPVFENQTPVGFSSSDSTRQSRFTIDSDITVLVDLNEAANATYPVIGNFQKVEQAVPAFTGAETSAAASQAVAIDESGVIHRAWIQRRGVVDFNFPESSPVYGVVYAKSFDGGRSFTDTVSVSGTMRFDLLTPSINYANGRGSSGFSTVELVVDSKGNPRVAYAMDWSADDSDDGQITSANGHPEQRKIGLTDAAPGRTQARSFDGIFFNYSNDGGSSWLPANGTVTVNDTSTVGVGFGAGGGTFTGRKTSFPRMAVTSTDDIFIVYQRQNADIVDADIVLAKMDSDSLQLGSAQPVRFGSLGTPGSLGGVRIDPDDAMGVTPDIAVGDGDVLHIVWVNPEQGVESVQHKTIPAEDWNDVSVLGLSQTALGATVGTFEATNLNNMGMNGSSFYETQLATGGLLANRMHLFPTVVVDRERTPDRIYTLWKHTDAITVNPANDENIIINTYDYDGQVAGNGVWGTSTPVFSTGGSVMHRWYWPKGAPLFQNGTRHQIQDDWLYVDRVAAVVDRRIPGVRGDLHIVFSAGSTNTGAGPGGVAVDLTSPPRFFNQLYYSRYNGAEWELPQVVASSQNTGDGVLARHDHVYGADLAMRSGDDNVYMTFVGGSIRASSSRAGGRIAGPGGATAVQGPDINNTGATGFVSGFGYRSLQEGSISPGNYFKVVGRVVTFDDRSNPAGAHNYHLTYNPVNPHLVASLNNVVTVTAADNQDGSGIGGAAPTSSSAPGGFLTGQWRNVTAYTLGVSSLAPGTAGAVYKGADNPTRAMNNRGVFHGQVDDDGASGFGQWGDNGDKSGLLVKLNVLGSDSSTNVYLIASSSAAKSAPAVATERGSGTGRTSQSLTLSGIRVLVNGLTEDSFVKGTRSIPAGVIGLNAQNVKHAAQLLPNVVPMGSYFIISPDIDITAANAPPSVSVLSPDANTIGSGAFANETFSIQYTLFDVDDSSSDTDSDTLRAALYAYPGNGLLTVQDIETFATLIVDERDISTSATRKDAAAADRFAAAVATGDFAEGSSAGNSQAYTWDNPGSSLTAAFGWAPITKMLDSNYYIYIVGDDGVNPAVFAVSQGALRVRHIPIIRSVAPVAADTVDTGEYSNLAKANPYKIKFSVVDYDDNAQMRLFIASSSGLAAAAVTVTGTYPDQALALAGATEIQLSDTLRTDEDIEFYFDVTAQGSARDSVIVQGNYFIYAVAADEDTFALGVSSNSLAIRHSPAFEFTAPLTDVNMVLDPSQQDRFTIQWQRGRSDQDLDGNAIISLYYTGVDRKTVDYSGTDSTRLLATSGVNPGSAVLITGNIREDDEGANDQYVWNFRNPPGDLPKQFRPAALDVTAEAAALVGHRNPHLVQVGSTVDTAWVYAVLHDSLGNTRVQVGGSILLKSGMDGTSQPTPKVTMKTPPSGGQTMVNGDIVRLEWDSFLIDDGTGTDDAYLRLYAAPKGKYATLTDLEGNASGAGGSADVFIINSANGQLAARSGGNDAQAYDPNLRVLRESGDNFILWDTKTTSFRIQGTPTEFDIFIAASMDRRFGDHIYVGNSTVATIDSVASGIGSEAFKAVLSKAPGSLRVEGADPIYSIELGPGTMTAATGDTLSMDLLVNSQNSSIDLMAIHLNVPRNYFEIIDMDAATAGLQPFADSTGAFKTPSTIAQNDTTQGTDQFIKLNFVESIVAGEVVGNSLGDSSQVAARMRLLVKQYAGGAPLDTSLVWSQEAGRKTGFRRGTVALAAPAREGFVTLTPGARLIVTAPLEGRSNYADTLDVHLRQIGSLHDITNQVYIRANDVVLDTISGSGVTTITDLDLSDVIGTFVASETVTGGTSGATGTVTAVSGTVVSLSPVTGTFSAEESVTGGTSTAVGTIANVTTSISGGNVVFGDSVQVVSDAFGTITVTEIPTGIYELTVKADGYISGRTDTLNLFNGMTLNPDPTFGSDVLGNLSPARPLGFLRGGDATGDNQVDIADANLIFSIWNQTLADAGYVRGADVNADGVINAIDLGFVTANFGNDGFGAPPVFKRITEAGDNSVAVVEVKGVEEVDAWWPGRVFEVTTRATGMSDVMAYDLAISYDPDRVKLLSGSQAVSEGDVFAENARGTLFFQRAEPGLIEVAAGRVGRDMTASGNADLVTLRFVTLADDPGLIEVVSGQLVNSAYQGVDMRVKKAQALPQIAALHQNFPNPFNPSTEIRFDIPTARNVELRVYNQLGQTVRTLVQSRMKAGTYRIKWDGRTEAGHGVSSGVYFYSLEAGAYSQIRKMTLVK